MRYLIKAKILHAENDKAGPVASLLKVVQAQLEHVVGSTQAIQFLSSFNQMPTSPPSQGKPRNLTVPQKNKRTK